MRPTLTTAAALVALAVALAGCGSAELWSRASSKAGSFPAASEKPTDVDGASVVAVEQPPTDQQAPDPAALIPASLALPTLGTSAPVVPVGVDDGILGVPSDAAVLGWWTGGARPGEGSGTIVLDGHVTYRGERGVLADVGDLAAGDEVVLATADGSRWRYATVEVAAYEKSVLPYWDIFRADVPERLVLITCGGEVDASTGHYDHNVVVYLDPV